LRPLCRLVECQAPLTTMLGLGQRPLAVAAYVAHPWRPRALNLSHHLPAEGDSLTRFYYMCGTRRNHVAPALVEATMANARSGQAHLAIAGLERRRTGAI
jgi:hypothetical protein